MNYEEAAKILEKHLIPLWSRYPAEELLKFMRPYARVECTHQSDYITAYQYFTASKEREKELEAWFLIHYKLLN